MRTVVALYDRFEDARQAVQALRDENFSREEINLVARDASGAYANALGQPGEQPAAAGLGGLLTGLGAMSVPGIGPVVAAGPMVATLAGSGMGGMSGGIVSAMAQLGIPEEHASLYAEGIRRGGTLVTVRAPDDRADAARLTMNRFNPLDIESRGMDWRKSQWQGFDPQGAALGAEQMEFNRGMPPSSEQPPQVPAEEPADEEQPGMPGGRHLNEDIYSKERVTDENMVDIPVTGTMTPEFVHDTREGASELPIDTEDYGTFDQDFHTHYQSRYAAGGMPYVNYQPAYQYGYWLASEPQYQDYTWERIEPLAQEQWRRRSMHGVWDEVKDAVQHAWDSVTHRI